MRIELGESKAGQRASELGRTDPAILVRVQRAVVWIDPRTLSDSDAENLLVQLTSGPLRPR